MLSMVFRYWLGRRSVDDERQINRWKGIANRLKGKLIKMIKDVNGKFDYYSISPKNRQILLHWVYELTESDLLLFCFHIFTSFIYSVIIIIFFSNQISLFIFSTCVKFSL